MRHACPSRACLLLLLLAALVLSACSRSGPIRRISEPAASIQQLSVGIDGQWTLDLRLQNFSSIPMRFDALSLELHIGDTNAGTLTAEPALTVGPESADVVTLALQPAPDARLMIADALARARGLSYRIEGTLSASPHDKGKPRHYEIQRSSMLSPVPGLPGVLR